MASSHRQPNTTDRLSSLPDHLLHHILYFLADFHDSINTSFISRRFRNLWTSNPNLNFDLVNDLEPSVVHHALILYNATNLQNLTIFFHNPEYVDTWIRFAVGRNVQRLDLALDLHYGPRRKVHSSLYRCQSLESLKLRYMDLNLPPSIHLLSLKTLHLQRFDLSEEDMTILIDGCPNLEGLVLRYCNTDADIRIHAPNHSKLKNLWIEDYKEVWKSHESQYVGIEVFAPNLQSLRLGGCLRNKYYCLGNVSSLVAASFDFEGVCARSGQLDQLMRLLDAVSHVRTLKLCGWCLQVLSTWEENHGSPIPFNATYLELKTGLFKWDLLGMSYLLKSSNYLEDIVVNVDEKSLFLKDIFSPGVPDVNEYWKSLELSLPCQLWQVRTIRIYGLMGSMQLSKKERFDMAVNEFIDRRQNEVLLVKFLLKNCRALEKMIIRMKGHQFGCGSEEISEVVLNRVRVDLSRRLLLMPRASPKAEVVFT